MREINDISFTSLNFLELLVLVCMIYLIKDIKDELSIRNELFAVTVLWVVFSIIYAMSYRGYESFI
jgi:hypothetical protein